MSLSSPKVPKKTPEQSEFEQLQLQELRRLRAAEDRRNQQLTRARRGRASLVTGSELGLVGS